MGSGRVDVDAALAGVAALDCDVVALQEVDRAQPRSGGIDQTAALAARVGGHGIFAPALLGSPDTSWTAVGAADPGGPAYGVGLVSRYPVVAWASQVLPGGGDGERAPGASPQNPGWDHEPRVALSATLDVGGRAVRVTTTHLSYLPWRGVAQLRAAASAAADGAEPAVLVGDLNLPVWPVRLALPTWRHAGGAPTYPAWNPRVQVDQLLVRGAIAVREVTAGARTTSDHLPLVATLTLP